MEALLAAGQVTAGWKWLAVLIGFGVLALVWIFVGITNTTTRWSVWKLVYGADGKPSTSKFQWMLWLVVIVFAYSVLWVLRARQGNFGAISHVPVNLLTVLGFSTVTTAAAKGITLGYVQTGRLTKSAPAPPPAAAGAVPAAPAAPAPAQGGGILQDDDGYPELAKIQMVAFTFVAVGIFLATLVHQIFHDPVQTGLPNIDSSLLVLMGISQGGYLGKKLVSVETGRLYAPPSPPSGAPGAQVTIRGDALGATQGGGQLVLDGFPIVAATWGDSSITFAIPPTHPAGRPWTPPEVVKIGVQTVGRSTNELLLTVT
jgi:hypothetical protein